jgi:hypothetical protein
MVRIEATSPKQVSSFHQKLLFFVSKTVKSFSSDFLSFSTLDPIYWVLPLLYFLYSSCMWACHHFVMQIPLQNFRLVIVTVERWWN